MRYGWNEKKRLANLLRHNVDFAEAYHFEWDSALEILDNRKDYGEERWIAVGYIGKRLHVMVYTLRDSKIRIISLRKANQREKRYYHEKEA